LETKDYEHIWWWRQYLISPATLITNEDPAKIDDGTSTSTVNVHASDANAGSVNADAALADANNADGYSI
jgi:hypothetical protein